MKKFLASLLAVALYALAIPASAQTVGTAATSGPVTGSNCLVLPLTPGQSNASVSITGTFTSGTINFLLSNDGTNYFTSPTDSITSATADGLSFVTVASAKFFEACGSTVVGSPNVSIVATAAVAPKGGGGSSSNVNITSVGGNAVTTTIPVSGTVTTTPSGSQTVIQPTASNLNAAVVGVGSAGTPSGGVLSVQGVASGAAVPTSCTASTCLINVSQLGGTGITASVGFGGQQIYPANTAGGGCQGVNAVSGTQIIKTVIGQVNNTTATQFIGLVASKFIHICAFWYNGTVTTAGQYTISVGTGTNCATGGVVLWRLDTGTGNYTFVNGNGADSILEVPSGNALCASDTSIGTTRAYFTYAQY